VGFYGCGAGRGARAGSRGGRRAQWPGERTDRGRPRGAAASESRALAARRSAARRSRSPTASRGATASERAAAGARPRGPSAAPRRRGAPPRRPRAPHSFCQGEGFHAGRGGCRLHSPSSSSLRPSPRSSHIMAAALARASSFAGQRRDSALAEMMEVRGWRVAPEASAFPGVPGCMHGLRGRVGRKTRCFFTDFAFDDQVLRRGRLPHLARDRHQLADAAHQARLPQNWTLLHRSARRSRNSSDHKVASCCSAPRNARCARARARSPRS
jgi:hypothetical protein